LMPGREGKLISRLGTVLDRQQFEKMKDEYYQHRGWDVNTGFPAKAKLEQLGLSDIVSDLENRGLLAP
jgi:aldehyde:ferredoxin oxidoreductase